MKGVSVIIPTYNREKFIAEAIESILNQDFTGNIEIIISDDGSTDGTLKIAKAFGDKVKILFKPKNCKFQGPASTRNRGIYAATQSYILFLDSDDFFLPGHIKNMVSVLESDSDLGFAFCRILEMNENTKPQTFKLWSKEVINRRDILHLNISKHNVAQTNGFIFKKEVFEKVGVFNEKFYHAEDIDLWMRVSELYKGTFSDHCGAILRRNGSDQLTSIPKEALLKIQSIVFAQALKRNYKLRPKNRYRLLKLIYINFYYKTIQKPLVVRLFIWSYKMKYKKKSTAQLWYPLSHFIKA